MLGLERVGVADDGDGVAALELEREVGQEEELAAHRVHLAVRRDAALDSTPTKARSSGHGSHTATVSSPLSTDVFMPHATGLCAFLSVHGSK